MVSLIENNWKKICGVIIGIIVIPMQIEITHHVAWKGTTGCDVDAIGQQTLLDGRGMLVCQSGCSGVLGNMSFFCSLFNQAEDWIAGKRSYITRFGRNVKTFEAMLVTHPMKRVCII